LDHHRHHDRGELAGERYLETWVLRHADRQIGAGPARREEV
jgi:hypothetical protein